MNDLPKVVSLLPESAGVELATFRVKVQCHNHYAFMPDCFKSHFGMWSHGARGEGHFGGHTWSCQDLPVLSVILNFVC